MEKSQREERIERREITSTAVSKPKNSEKPSAMEICVKPPLKWVGDRVSE